MVNSVQMYILMHLIQVLKFTIFDWLRIFCSIYVGIKLPYIIRTYIIIYSVSQKSSPLLITFERLVISKFCVFLPMANLLFAGDVRIRVRAPGLALFVKKIVRFSKNLNVNPMFYSIFGIYIKFWAQ
uniref:Uncharacterized protein n=1 Tax=Cacopsylla melanoneura TaxID=428564 RepID=A0A8D8LAA7_9HEMI